MAEDRVSFLKQVRCRGPAGPITEQCIEYKWVLAELKKADKSSRFTSLPYRRKQVEKWAEKSKEEWLSSIVDNCEEDEPRTKRMGKRPQ